MSLQSKTYVVVLSSSARMPELSREIALVAANIVIFAMIIVDRMRAFKSWVNIRAVFSQTTYDLLFAVAMIAMLLARGLDFSLRSVFALSSVAFAITMSSSKLNLKPLITQTFSFEPSIDVFERAVEGA